MRPPVTHGYPRSPGVRTQEDAHTVAGHAHLRALMKRSGQWLPRGHGTIVMIIEVESRETDSCIPAIPVNEKVTLKRYDMTLYTNG